MLWLLVCHPYPRSVAFSLAWALILKPLHLHFGKLLSGSLPLASPCLVLSSLRLRHVDTVTARNVFYVFYDVVPVTREDHTFKASLRDSVSPRQSHTLKESLCSYSSMQGLSVQCSIQKNKHPVGSNGVGEHLCVMLSSQRNLFRLISCFRMVDTGSD